ncbi:hypothetical protein ACU1JV_00560 [Paenibacillus sp. T2-29]|uniref:hypothetical protein n=1 Tax=Paenibacillus TaxID=44249 RepID=UPI0039BC8F6C
MYTYYPYPPNQPPSQQFHSYGHRQINRQSKELYITQDTKTTDLGDGFYSLKWGRFFISPNTYFTATINTGSYKVLSAGFGITGIGSAYAVESLPTSRNEWHIVVHNNTNTQREVTFTATVKS